MLSGSGIRKTFGEANRNTTQASLSEALLQRKQGAMAGPIPLRSFHLPDVVHMRCGINP
jgi:hypothetical protein